tara:strand:- start:291 stop:527 length:237 start_codon:yes stop_codon:yes gene_type:complete
MKALVRAEAQIKTLRIENRTPYFKEKVNSSINIVDFKLYQKLFLLLVAFSIILIFPESPREMESLCKDFYTDQKCNVF